MDPETKIVKMRHSVGFGPEPDSACRKGGVAQIEGPCIIIEHFNAAPPRLDAQRMPALHINGVVKIL